MASNVHETHSLGLIKPPPYVLGGLQYECIMGSEAYGMSSNTSDRDIYGWCFPPKHITFPHLAGIIPGFGSHAEKFDQWQQHHTLNKNNGKEYDFQIFSIVKYFHLAFIESSPNVIDSLFVPQRCVTFCTKVGDIVRSNRQSFLNKKSYHTYKGYAYSQLNKVKFKGRVELREFQELHHIYKNTTPDQYTDILNNDDSQDKETKDFLLKEYTNLWTTARKLPDNKKRAETVERVGYDTKFASHVVRLLNEAEQILVEHNLDLERNSEQLKSIRRGDWTLEQLEKYFTEKELSLEKEYAVSTLPHDPNEKAGRNLLLNCCEEYYGNIGMAVTQTGMAEKILGDIRNLLSKFPETP